MSDLKTTLTVFDVYDYKNEQVLSSYNLEQTPLKFIPDLSLFPDKDVVWSFGDGTISKSITAAKYYNFPGVYTVNLFVYNCDNNVLVSSFSQDIVIKDYIPYTLNFSNLSSNKPYIELKQSEIHGPWNLNITYPWHQPTNTIKYSVENSNSSNFFKIKSDKFSHLRRTHSLFDSFFNFNINNNQYYEIPEIKIDEGVKLFAKIENNTIINCSETDIGAFFVGTSASKNIYYKDDSVGNTSIFFEFDTDNTSFREKSVDYLNNLGVALSANIIPNDEAFKLSVTSNGIDGEKTSIDSFNIHDTKFFNSEIPFVIKIKDEHNHSLKNFNPIQLSDIHISVLSGYYLTNEYNNYILTEDGSKIIVNSGVIPSSYYTISSLNHTLNSLDHGGSFRGYIKFPILSNPLDVVQLSCSIVAINENLSSFTLSGSSSDFGVYPHNHFDIYKVNENFNASQTMHDLAFQERIKKSKVIFEDFLGTAFGSDTYDHNSIGVKTYERIANFIQNNIDIDTKNISSLISDMHLVGNETVEFRIVPSLYPDNIERIVNLASMDASKLTGQVNKFNQNFDSKGQFQKTIYGKNIGNEINTLTYTITAGVPIVALEKFSNTYTLLNTYQPLCAGSGHQYNLSQYTDEWGWPLVLPSSFTSDEFEKYYLFFEYVPMYDGTLVGNIIDFSNEKTTIEGPTPSNDYLFSKNGAFDKIFLDYLYQSLSI